MKFNGTSFVHSTLEEGYDFNIKDEQGREYHFKISTFPCPTGQVSEAIEYKADVDEPRYMFEILSPDEEDIEKAELLLKAKIKRGINRKHLENKDGYLRINDNQILRGRIEWSEDSPETQFDRAFVIDGKQIRLEDFAKLLEPYEGWCFKFEIKERSAEED